MKNLFSFLILNRNLQPLYKGIASSLFQYIPPHYHQNINISIYHVLILIKRHSRIIIESSKIYLKYNINPSFKLVCFEIQRNSYPFDSMIFRHTSDVMNLILFFIYVCLFFLIILTPRLCLVLPLVVCIFSSFSALFKRR